MRCPKCGSEGSSVIDSRSDGTVTRRRRECQDCAFRFSTLERIEHSLPMVVKKDGRREAFDREKVRSGILKACEKRPGSVEPIDQHIEAMERKIQGMFLKEIESRHLGDLIMEALKGMDKIAYVRFASVYREFSDVSQFVDTLKSLDDNGSKRAKRQRGRQAGDDEPHAGR